MEYWEISQVHVDLKQICNVSYEQSLKVKGSKVISEDVYHSNGKSLSCVSKFTSCNKQWLCTQIMNMFVHSTQ